MIILNLIEAGYCVSFPYISKMNPEFFEHCAEPDAAKLTQPKEIADNLETESGRAEIQAQLEYGALPLSPQGYHEVLSRFPDMKEKIVASHSLLASTFTALLLAFEPTMQEGEVHLYVLPFQVSSLFEQDCFNYLQLIVKVRSR